MRESSSHFEPGKWLSASPRTLLSAGWLRYFKNQTFTTCFLLFFYLYAKTLHFRAVFLLCIFFINTFWSCWADSNRRPHPYQKPLLIVDKYPFMLGYFPESLVVQGVRGFPFSSCVIRVCLVLGRFIPSAGRFVGSCLGFIALDNSQTHSHRWNLRLPLRCDRCT